MHKGGNIRLANWLCAGVMAVVLAAPVAAVLQPPAAGEAIAVFAPGTGATATMTASVQAGAEGIRLLPGGDAALVILPGEGAAALRRAGALLVIRPIFAAGCSPAAALQPEPRPS